MRKPTYEESFASSSKVLFWSNKNNLNPSDVWKKSYKKYIFDCSKCNHQFDMSLNNISSNNQWCPYCNKNKLCNNNECKICFDKSFAAHSRVKYWSTKNILEPRNVSICSNNKYYFNCNECKHELYIQLSGLKRNRWCKYCTNQSLCDNNDCKLCFDKSFASHPNAKYWSKINILNPRNAIKGSECKYFFDCPECKHIFQSRLICVTNGKWCHYCSSTSNILCDNNDCKICFDKSFASHPKAKYWSSKNKITPREVKKCSNQRFIFNCDECKNEFEGHLGNITCGNNWCPKCINKTEKIVFNELKQFYSTLEHQFRVDWCKNKKLNIVWPFDFVISDLKIIIELDGEQHFTQVSSWKSPEFTQERDIYKMKCANENGYSVIRILQDDVYNNKYDWLNELKLYIEKIISEKKVQNIFMCKKNEYKIFDNIK